MRREVLLIAYSFPPHGAVGALRPARFAKYLPKYGYRATVLTATGSGERVRLVPDPQPWWAKRLWRVLPDTGLGWAGPAAAEALRMVRQARIPALVSTAPPFPAHCAALWVKRKEPRVKWVADFRDPLVGSPERIRPGRKLLDATVEQMIFRHADAVIANTDAAGELWRERYPQWRNKVHVIWNGFDPEEPAGPAPIPPRPYRVLLHPGDLYRTRHPGPVIEALERLGPNFGLRLRFIGSDPEETGEPERYRIAAAKGLAEFLPRVEKSEAAARMAEADYLLLLDFYRDGEPPLQLPSKIFDYVRIGRPIVAVTTKGSPVERVLERSGIPAVVLYYGDDPGRNAQKLQSLAALPADPAPMSEWFRRTFNGEEQTGTLAGILDRCLEAP